MKTNRNFHAKILLFGEYSVICNSMGLTIPYAAYSGRLRKTESPTANQQSSITVLRGFYDYLSRLPDKEFTEMFDLSAFEAELKRGLYFDSDIPQRYGVGSSGALCAAVYERFGPDGQNKNLPELRNFFARMESYFHGTSSGLDPLISYLNKPLLIKDKDSMEPVEIPRGLLSDQLTAFLVDTGQTGKSENYVQMFLDKCRSDEFLRAVHKRLIPLNNSCIQKFMAEDISAFLQETKQLSAFFLEHFRPMIPPAFLKLWEKGTDESCPYALKLCGSGGGGFLLGFTGDFEATKKEFRNNKLLRVQ